MSTLEKNANIMDRDGADENTLPRLAAVSWVFSAAPLLSVLVAVAEGRGGIPFIALSISWAFPG